MNVLQIRDLQHLNSCPAHRPISTSTILLVTNTRPSPWPDQRGHAFASVSSCCVCATNVGNVCDSAKLLPDPPRPPPYVKIHAAQLSYMTSIGGEGGAMERGRLCQVKLHRASFTAFYPLEDVSGSVAGDTSRSGRPSLQSRLTQYQQYDRLSFIKGLLGLQATGSGAHETTVEICSQTSCELLEGLSYLQFFLPSLQIVSSPGLRWNRTRWLSGSNTTGT